MLRWADGAPKARRRVEIESVAGVAGFIILVAAVPLFVTLRELSWGAFFVVTFGIPLVIMSALSVAFRSPAMLKTTLITFVVVTLEFGVVAAFLVQEITNGL
jgi:hypothetical protein